MDEEKTFKQRSCSDPDLPHEGFIILQDESGQFFHAYLSGEPAYPQRYEKIQHFQSGWAWVMERDFEGITRWKMIDKFGTQVHGPTSHTIASK